MNLFDGLKVYAGNWKVRSERPFNDEEIAFISYASVVISQYGKSVEFILQQGGKVYIPLDQFSEEKLSVGDVLDLHDLSIVTLFKAGEADINRVKYNK